MVGLLPLCATTTLGTATLQALPRFAERYRWFVANRPEAGAVVGRTHVRDGAEGRLLSMVGPAQLERILGPMLDEAEFLSPHGLRSVSRRHAAEPFVLEGAAAFGRYERYSGRLFEQHEIKEFIVSGSILF